MKKIISFILAIASFGVSAAAFSGCGGTSDDDRPPYEEQEILAMPETPSEGLEYELNEDGTGYIFVGLGSCRDANVRIADEYESLPVVKISQDAFSFMYGGMISFTIGANVTDISTDSLGESSVSYLSLQAFFVAEENTAYKVIDGNLYTADGSVLIKYAVESPRASYSLPETTVEIKPEAFNGCNKLENLTIPEGVEIIGQGAFAFCRKLTSIHLPSTVTSFGDTYRDTYNACFLKEISVAEGNTVYKSIDGVLYSKDGTTLLKYPSCKENASFEIPSSVTSIANNAFQYNEKITNVTIGTSVATIGEWAFAKCSNLATVLFPEGWDCSVTKIGRYAFSNTALTSIQLPWRVEVLEGETFKNCSNLTSVQLTLNLQEIGSSVFSGCDKLLVIDFSGFEIDWTGIKKNESWMADSSLTKVICNDMEVELQ